MEKIAFSHGNGARVQFINDSISDFDFIPDMDNKIIKLTSWTDSTNIAILHFSETNPGEWLFKGKHKEDSVHFYSTKIDIYSLPLFKYRGKIKWFYP